MTAPRKRGGVSCVHEVETASHSLVYMGTNAERNDLLQCLAPPDGARSPVERSRLEDGVVGDARALVSGHTTVLSLQISWFVLYAPVHFHKHQ